MSPRQSELYEFGPFLFDVTEHTLVRKDGVQNGRLAEKPFQTLGLLVRNSGHLLTKAEILNHIWPDSFVEENNLDKCIHAVRHALGERPGEARFIETVRKHGYRFVAEVRRIEKFDCLAATTRPRRAVAEGRAGIIGAVDRVVGREQRYRSAFEVCQQARLKYEQMTAPTTLEARELVTEALRLDEKFALAHSLSAELTTLEVIVGLKWPEAGFAEARASIGRARELGANSPDFYAAAAYVDLIADWNFGAAEQNLRKALAQNPHHGPANRMIGETYMFQGRHDEASLHIKRANVETGMHTANILAISHFLAHDYPSVIAACDYMLALSPRHIVPMWTKCWAFEQMGRIGDAIAGYSKILGLTHGEPALRWIGYAYALAGDRTSALEIAARLEAASKNHNVSPTHTAAIYAGLGEIAEAVKHVEKALEMRDPFMLWIGTDPRFDDLRGDRRFDQIVKLVFPKLRSARKKSLDRRVNVISHS